MGCQDFYCIFLIKVYDNHVLLGYQWLIFIVCVGSSMEDFEPFVIDIKNIEKLAVLWHDRNPTPFDPFKVGEGFATLRASVLTLFEVLGGHNPNDSTTSKALLADTFR